MRRVTKFGAAFLSMALRMKLLFSGGGEPKRSWQKKKTRPQFVLVFEIEETANINRSKGYNPTALADLERLDPGFRDRFELELAMARLRL